jgi:transcriptional regulator with XRE-family HTH domain
MEADWFAARLKELRERAELSQEQLAHKAGLKVGGIRDLEQGRNSPKWETVIALAKALGVSCEAFLEQATPRPPAGPGRPPKAVASAEAPPGSPAAAAPATPGRGKGKPACRKKPRGKKDG